MQDTSAPCSLGWRPNALNVSHDGDLHLLSDEDLLAFLDKDGFHALDLHSLLSPGVNQVHCLASQDPYHEQTSGKAAAAVTGAECSLSATPASSQDTFSLPATHVTQEQQHLTAPSHTREPVVSLDHGHHISALTGQQHIPLASAGPPLQRQDTLGQATAWQELQPQQMPQHAGLGKCMQPPVSCWQTLGSMPAAIFSSCVSQNSQLSAVMPSESSSAMQIMQVQPGLSNPLPAGCTLSLGGMQIQQQNLVPIAGDYVQQQQQQQQQPIVQPQIPLLQVPPVSFMQLLADSPMATVRNDANAMDLQEAAAGSVQHALLIEHGRGVEQPEHHQPNSMQSVNQAQHHHQQLQQTSSRHGQSQDQVQKQQPGNNCVSGLPKCRAPFIPRVLSQAQYHKRQAASNDAIVVGPATYLALPPHVSNNAWQSRKGKKQTTVEHADADADEGTDAVAAQALPVGGNVKKKEYSRAKKVATAMLCDSMQHQLQRRRHRVNLEHQFKLWKQVTQTEEADAAVAGDQSTAARAAAGTTMSALQLASETSLAEAARAAAKQPPAAEASAAAATPAAPTAVDKGQKLSYKTPHDLAKVVEELFLSDGASHMLHLPLCRPGQPQLQLMNGPSPAVATLATQQRGHQQDMEQQYSAVAGEKAKLEKQHAKAWGQVIRSCQSLNEATQVAEIAMKVAELQHMQLHPRTLDVGKHRNDVAAAIRRFEAVKQQKVEAYAAECKQIQQQLSEGSELQQEGPEPYAGATVQQQQPQCDNLTLKTRSKLDACTIVAGRQLSNDGTDQLTQVPETTPAEELTEHDNGAIICSEVQPVQQDQQVCQQQQWQDARCTVSRLSRTRNSKGPSLQHQQHASVILQEAQMVAEQPINTTGSAGNLRSNPAADQQTHQHREITQKQLVGGVDSSVTTALSAPAAAAVAAEVNLAAPSSLVQMQHSSPTRVSVSEPLYCLQAAAAAATEYFSTILAGSNLDVTTAFPTSALDILQRAATAAGGMIKEQQAAEAAHQSKRAFQGTSQISSESAPAAVHNAGAPSMQNQQHRQCCFQGNHVAGTLAGYAALDGARAASCDPGQMQSFSSSRPQRKRKRSAVLQDYQGDEEVLQGDSGTLKEQAVDPASDTRTVSACGKELPGDQECWQQGDTGESEKDLLFNLSSRSFRFKRRTGADKGKFITVTTETLKELYDLPMKEAARALGASEGATVLKKICRQLGIKRWPQRKRRCVRNLIDEVESYRTAVGRSPEAEDILRQLTQTLEELDENPNLDLDPRIKQLRQAISKQLYKARMRGGTG